ncbi:MAG: hypothetical protein P1U36_01130 [Legionellaceae bacterium]|nr:hypothetical protein [Legionellaceae bacterium]
MDASYLEDAFFSFIDWCSAEADVASVGSSEESSVSIKDQVIREHLIGDWQDVQTELKGLKAEISVRQARLSKYVVGVDDKHMLNAICETTSQSFSFLLDDKDENPGFKKGLDHAALEERIKTGTDNLQHVEGLQVEGSGGVGPEENIRLYQLAYYLIHTTRDLLDVMTCLCGYQSKKNSLAESFMHRPFFFQTPCSPQEIIDIRKARDDLKEVIEQVNQKQDALNRALHPEVYVGDDSGSIYSDDSFTRTTSFGC